MVQLKLLVIVAVIVFSVVVVTTEQGMSQMPDQLCLIGGSVFIHELNVVAEKFGLELCRSEAASPHSYLRTLPALLRGLLGAAAGVRKQDLQDTMQTAPLSCAPTWLGLWASWPGRRGYMI